MTNKLFEIRDKATFIPILATEIRSIFEKEIYLNQCAGFETPKILITKLETMESNYDPYNWKIRSRTMITAHLYIFEHWYELQSGDVIDIEFILGETSSPKSSQRLESFKDF